MDLVGILIFLLISAIAGWLACQIMKNGSFGLLGDIIVGIVGSAIASFILPRLGIMIGGGVLGASKGEVMRRAWLLDGRVAESIDVEGDGDIRGLV